MSGAKIRQCQKDCWYLSNLGYCNRLNDPGRPCPYNHSLRPTSSSKKRKKPKQKVASTTETALKATIHAEVQLELQARLQELRLTIDKRNAEVAEKEAVIAKKDTVIAEKVAEISVKDAEIARMEHLVLQFKKAI